MWISKLVVCALLVIHGGGQRDLYTHHDSTEYYYDSREVIADKTDEKIELVEPVVDIQGAVDAHDDVLKLPDVPQRLPASSDPGTHYRCSCTPGETRLTAVYKCVPPGMHLVFNNLTVSPPSCPLCQKCIKCGPCPVCAVPQSQARPVRRASRSRTNQACLEPLAPFLQTFLARLTDEMDSLNQLLSTTVRSISAPWDQDQDYINQSTFDQALIRLSSSIHAQFVAVNYQIKQQQKISKNQLIKFRLQLMRNLSFTPVDPAPVEGGQLTSLAVSMLILVVLLLVTGSILTYGLVYFYRRYVEVTRRQVVAPPPIPMDGFQMQNLNAPAGEDEEQQQLQINH